MRHEILLGTVLHLTCSEMKCLNVFRLFQRCTACFGRRGGESGNSTASGPGNARTGRRSAVQVDRHLCLRHNWQVQLCPHSFRLTPQPSDLSFPFVLHQICCNVTSAYERKGKTSVILPHAESTHAAVPVATDALSFIASLLNLHWAGGRALVLRRVV